MKRYPRGPGYVRRSDTSREAAESVDSSAASMRSLIYSVLEKVRPGGLTVDEIEEHLDMRHQTASARMRELVLAGRVRDSHQRRPTRSGRNAIVWIVRPEGE